MTIEPSGIIDMFLSINLDRQGSVGWVWVM